MPTTLVGLLLFVVLLAPGLIFLARARVTRPVSKPSALREAARLGLLSVASDLGAIALFGVARGVFPNHTPDVGGLIRDPSRYFRSHYAYLVLWGTALLVVACILALLGAVALSSAAGQKILSWRGLALLVPPSVDYAREPAWWQLFTNRPERIHVGCQLDDGTYVAGFLSTFSAESDETPDRELVLAGDLKIRVVGGALEDYPASALVVSARRLQYLAVTYVPDEELNG